MIECAQQYDFDTIVLVQATSPLLSSDDISLGMEIFRQENIDSVLSVVRQKRFVWDEEGTSLTPVNYDPLKRPRRQEFNGFLVENGAFYITSRKALMTTGCRISGRIGKVEMDESTYFEIDEPSDFGLSSSIC